MPCSLLHENKGGLKEPDDVKAENYGEGYGEDKAEYYAGLIEFVASFNDERSITALLGATEPRTLGRELCWLWSWYGSKSPHVGKPARRTFCFRP
jgi:hypothetical protein